MSELSNLERIYAARESGAVTRCHVVPHHGAYNVAMHCYNAVSMLMVLHPDPSVALIKALLWHDGGERWVGDMPYPAKWYNTDLREAYYLAEVNAARSWGLLPRDTGLTQDDTLWVNALDRMELLFWVEDQLAMGNRHVVHFKTDLDDYFDHPDRLVPEPCRTILAAWSWRRLAETPPGQEDD